MTGLVGQGAGPLDERAGQVGPVLDEVAQRAGLEDLDLRPEVARVLRGGEAFGEVRTCGVGAVPHREQVDGAEDLVGAPDGARVDPAGGRIGHGEGLTREVARVLRVGAVEPRVRLGQQRPSPQRRGRRRVGRDDVLHLAAAEQREAAVHPEQAQCCDEPGPGVIGRRDPGRAGERGFEVRPFALQPGQRRRVGGRRAGLEPLGELGGPGEMPATGHVRLAGVGEPAGREVPDGLQEPVPGLGTVVELEHRGIDEPGEQPRHVRGGERREPRDPGGGVRGAAADEDPEPAQEHLLVRTQQVVRPLDGREQGAVARRRAARRPTSSANRSSSPARIWPTVADRYRAAAISIARGSPSSPRHSATTSARSGVASGRAAAARSRKSRTAS